IYLLFNEGYHSTSGRIVRSELCNEALRLARLLGDHTVGASPETRAFCALVCLHAARIPGRLDGDGHLVSLRQHDRSRWNRELVREGQLWLERSACGANISRYHLEAAIAWHHAVAVRFEDTDWKAIGGLYDALMRIAPSPVVALNRAIAVGQRDGPRSGIAAIEAISGDERLQRYPFYHAALGEFSLDVRSHDRARRHFASAVEFARTPQERARLQLRLDACTSQPEAIVS
ncbi:MAG TPA: DUF6596 domain-containing protein, partial [Candidatus Acidoferrum sp.]|nr:DUF6596 domain-containing protein [Candidatus Acidoferrum sp.]